jgi:hypothetical protein
VSQVLIKWSDTPEALATCEDLKPHQQRFPNAAAWDKQPLMEGGCHSPCATCGGVTEAGLKLESRGR